MNVLLISIIFFLSIISMSNAALSTTCLNSMKIAKLDYTLNQLSIEMTHNCATDISSYKIKV